TQRRDVEGDRSVEPLIAPFDPLPENPPQSPMGQFVDQPVLFCQRNEVGRLDRSEHRVFPADQGFDLPKASITQRHLRLVDHVQPLILDRLVKAVDQPQLGARRVHRTSVALSFPSRSSSTSRRTGFSTGPTMLRPSAWPSRKADSSTRRSKPLTMRTGPRYS